MQHTLIPFKDRQRLHREYAARVITVSIFAVTVAFAVGIVALFPAFIRAWFYNYAQQNAVTIAKIAKPDESLEKAKSALAADSKLLAALAGNVDEVLYSDVLKSLISVHGRVSITNFSFSQTDPKSISINIKGTAPNRDELIAFKGRLEALLPGTKVDIPIDQLAKNTNPQFNLRFVKKLP